INTTKAEDTEDFIGKHMCELLNIFSEIQENYTKINQKDFYIENDEIKNLNKLSLEIKEQSRETFVEGIAEYLGFVNKKTEYYYFPYVSEGGEIGANVRKEYIGSFLRSTYKTNTEYYDLGLEIEKASDLHWFGTTKKGEEINKLLYSRMEEEGKDLPHYKNVLKQIEKTPEILEDYYHIEVKSKKLWIKSSLIKIGLSDSDKLFDKNKIAYSYNLSDKIKPKLIERKVFYPTFTTAEEEELPIAVLDKAILKCSEGSCPLELKVFSQKFKKTNNLLDATVLDYEGNKSIIPKGTLCNKNLINGVPQMCSGYISTNEWEQGSKGITLNGNTVLLSNCKCTCKCGGILTIVSSEGVAKAN
ncbi:MAG: PAAR-like protein, partial [Fusobacteriaceae bacterium]